MLSHMLSCLSLSYNLGCLFKLVVVQPSSLWDGLHRISNFATVNLPGAAAPGFEDKDKARVWLQQTRAANRTCKLITYKEVHLSVMSSLKLVLKRVDRWCINFISSKTVPSIYDSARKEISSSVTAVVVLRKFPAMSSCGCVSSLLKNMTMDWRTILLPS